MTIFLFSQTYTVTYFFNNKLIKKSHLLIISLYKYFKFVLSHFLHLLLCTIFIVITLFTLFVFYYVHSEVGAHAFDSHCIVAQKLCGARRGDTETLTQRWTTKYCRCCVSQQNTNCFPSVVGDCRFAPTTCLQNVTTNQPNVVGGQTLSLHRNPQYFRGFLIWRHWIIRTSVQHTTIQLSPAPLICKLLTVLKQCQQKIQEKLIDFPLATTLDNNNGESQSG